MDQDTLIEQPFNTGAFPSPRDYRDVPLAAAIAIDDVFAASLPSSYFEPVDDLPVWMQNKLGACVGHAGAKYKQQLDKLETGKISEYSARFLYAIAKARDGYNGEGTYPRLVASIIKDIGVSTEATVSNDTLLDHSAYIYGGDESKIPAAAYEEAKAAQIASYAFPNVKNAIELKAAIIRGHGAMLLMRVGEEWWKRSDGINSWAAADIIPLRAPKQITSGHEIYLYGYEDVIEGGRTRTKFYIFNSWSVQWGLSGKAWFYHDEQIPYLDEAITFVDLPNDLKERLKTLPSADTFKHNFATSLVAGARGPEVVALQTALMIDGEFDRELYTELLAGGDLGYFKPDGITQKAVLAFQIKHAVDKPAELVKLNGKYVGPKTRAALNALFNK